MRVGIQCWGSEGDVRPFLALGGALAAAGHRVALVATDLDQRDYERWEEPLGIRVRMVATPAVPREELDEIGRLLLRKNPFEQGRLITERLFRPVVPAMYEAARELCADSDVVVGHFFHYPVRAAAEEAGVPEVSVTLAGELIPSAAYPPTGLPALGGAGNRLWWGVAGWALDRAFLAPINEFRASVGLPALAGMRDAWHSRLLDLVAVSPALFPPAPDWDPRHRVAGFFSLAAASVPDPVPEAVARFLDAGPPPVFMGFGSLTPKHADARAEACAVLEEAAARAGCRALIQGLAPAGTGDGGDVLHVDRVPHATVFPRCAAVVHHGGAGTTQTALAAGVPAVIVPHVSDQFGWGALLQRAGVAPRPLRRTRMTARRLAGRIGEALDPSMAAEAAALGARVAAEDGTGQAVRWIEEAASVRSPAPSRPRAPRPG